MARVVVVHGVGRQLDTAETLLPALEPALRGGLNLALERDTALAAQVPPLAAGDVACVGYGHLFRRPGTRGGVPDFEATDVAPGFETELLMAWWEAAAAADPVVLGPDAATRGMLGYAASRPLTTATVQRALDALTRSRFFRAVSDSLLIAGLKQFRRYLTDGDLRTAVRARTDALIGPDTRVVVGHSLGSVVAYETLCARRTGQVASLVTLGSPLGIRNLTFDRLQPPPREGTGVWPPGLRHWHNVADAGDIVALVRELAPRFGPRVRDHRVHNGTTMHSMTAYLTAVETGAAIAEGLVHAAEPDGAEVAGIPRPGVREPGGAGAAGLAPPGVREPAAPGEPAP
ncbi:antibiotic ABC transporter ATP-binding protein [Streptomyces sp. bgisy100]|uniref:antibiotic ABC transporter ATP-binding protein n=1 Tax=Streptomyces sp. bgisy100 TaxID=3413783 RepID=UPI003D721FB6